MLALFFLLSCSNSKLDSKDLVENFPNSLAKTRFLEVIKPEYETKEQFIRDVLLKYNEVETLFDFSDNNFQSEEFKSYLRNIFGIIDIIYTDFDFSDKQLQTFYDLLQAEGPLAFSIQDHPDRYLAFQVIFDESLKDKEFVKIDVENPNSKLAQLLLQLKATSFPYDLQGFQRFLQGTDWEEKALEIDEDVYREVKELLENDLQKLVLFALLRDNLLVFPDEDLSEVEKKDKNTIKDLNKVAV